MNTRNDFPTEPIGEPFENEFFIGETTLEGDPHELAEEISLKMRSFNSLDSYRRAVYLAPRSWQASGSVVELSVVGEVDGYSSDIKEEWCANPDSFRNESAVTTYSLSRYLEEKLGLRFKVRPLSTSNLDDCLLIDAMNKQRRSLAYYSRKRYPSYEDLVSAGNQEDSLIGNQGEYAATSPYFSAVLRTRKPQDELNRQALAAACKFLFKHGGVSLYPQVAFQLEDGRFELRVAGCTYEQGRYLSKRVENQETPKGEKIPATQGAADPIAHYLGVTVEELTTYRTTAEHLEDIIEAERLADEVEALGLPEPEDFIVRSRKEVLADDELKRKGGTSQLREPELTGEEELNQLVGLNEVKRQIREFVSYAKACKARGSAMPHLHLRFDGNPGTGKTTVARIVGHMLYDAGLIPKRNVFVETSGNNFYEGDIRSARRGVLFVDEAYTLGYYKLATLVKAMEDCHQNYERDGFIVVLAGYPQEMEHMVSRNPGLRDRIGIALNFEDYTAEELMTIFTQLINAADCTLDKDAEELMREKFELIEIHKNGDFSNGRIVRKIYERMLMRQSTLFGDDSNIHVQTVEDVFADELADLVGGRRRTEAAHDEEDGLTGDEQLDKLVGMEETKRQIREFLDYAAVQKKRGGNIPSLHMRFDGNPGTGKTTLARIVGRMMYDRGLLSKRNGFVECDRENLVAPFVGWTAKATKRKIAEARNGVLFIDEAYSLDGGSENDFGKEAISTLVKAMEDCRENYEREGFVCIMAGYPELMDRMVSLNPGLRDRFGLTANFADYSADELLQVFELYAKDEKYTLAKAAKIELASKLRQIVAAKDDDFSNARMVRKIFERAKMRQASMHDTNSCIKADVIESVFQDKDIAELLNKQQKHIGF